MNESLEDLERVAAFESALQEFDAGPLEQRFPEAAQVRLGCSAWPLRPLFLKRQRLEQISASLWDLLQSARKRLGDFVDEPEQLASRLHFSTELLNRIDLKASLASPQLLKLARPDGFYFHDRFVVSELNVGSGLLATLCYTEVLSECFRPVLEKLGWSQDPLSRPLKRYLDSLGVRAGQRLGLLVPSEEMWGVFTWEKTLYAQIFQLLGLSCELIEPHQLRTRAADFDLVLQLTSGESYLAVPSQLWDCPVHPLACLLLNKGLLPWLQEQGLAKAPGLDLPATFFPEPEQADKLRLQKDDFVLKRAWDGKDTVIGCATHGRAWNRAVAQACQSRQYIAQHYCSLPSLQMPYWVEGRIVQVKVRFELSPFLVDGQYSGALVRYAPDREGVLLSPSPGDLGMTLVYCS